MNRSKRYSSNRNQGDYNSQNDWGDKSESRNYRMGSEPRGTCLMLLNFKSES